MIDSAGQVCLDLFVVRESTGENFREKVMLPFLELIPSPSFQDLERRFSDRVRNMLTPDNKKAILRDLSRRSATAENTHFSVCILSKKAGSFYGIKDGVGGEEILMYMILAGVDIREEDAVYWGSACHEIITVCKPPIPCLRRITVVDKEERSCSICLQELVVGSEAAKTTTCCHVYHCNCIVQWLLKHSNCPVCRSRLHY